MSKLKYPKIGTLLRVVTPMVFIRCGYTLTYDILCDKHSDKVYAMADKLYALLYDVPAPVQTEALPGWFSSLLSLNINASNIQDKEQRVYNHCVQAVCAKMLRDLEWGGKDRKVFEEPIDAWRLQGEQIWKLEKKRFVKTGTRYASHTSYSWDNEPDYEPGGLSDEKTHCVYTISNNGDELDILSVNCEAV